MTSDVIILAGAVAINMLLAFFVYYRNPVSATHRLFAALTLSIATWSIVNYFAVNSHTNPSATWLVRLVMFSSVPLGVLFYLLMDTFPRASLAMPRKRFYATLAVMVIVMGITLSPLLFPEVSVSENSAPQPRPGIGLVAYIPVVIFGILYGIFILVRKFFKTKGIEKVQTRYILTGVSVMFSLIIALNFISVVVFGNSSFNKFGPLFTLPFTVLATYTIVRHRLMDIRLAIARSLSLAFLVGGVLLVYGLLIVFAAPAVVAFVKLPVEVVAAGMALFSIPVARYVQKILSRVTERFLFQNKQDYRAALVRISQGLSRTIEIKEVENIVLAALEKVIKAEKAIIFLQEPKHGSFEPRASFGTKDFSIVIPHDNLIPEHMRHAEGVLIKDELAFELEQETKQAHIQELEGVKIALEWLDASVIIPLFMEKGLVGFIALGNKLSGEPYLKDDAEFLSALGPVAATALENARLYKESLEFGARLQREVKAATHELEIANKQLTNLDKAKSEFLSVASHQLYTPLTALRGYLSMLNEGDFGEVNEKQKPIVDILNKSTTRLISLIKNLLDISRIESGRLQLKLESVDLVEMARELVQDLMPNAIERGLKMQFIPPEGHVQQIVADRERLRQVMLNFISNSVKYTDRGKIDVSVKPDGQYLVFAVTDTGRGISAEDLDKLFTKFTRVGGDARLKTEGTGLGLYVARQIVREHHGEVEGTSPGEGKGSTFTMRVPIEGSPESLKLGDVVEVEIKAAEAEEVESKKETESEEQPAPTA